MSSCLHAWVAMVLLSLCGLGAAQTPTASSPAKVLRLAFPVAETGFDPAQISDYYSSTITGHIFEPLLTYDYLARPVKLKPLTAASMPEVSSDFTVFTFQLRPGIFFTPDPAFKGRVRELVAADYVYSIKRIFDPRWKSPAQVSVAEEGIVGLQALRDQALKSKRPFDYTRDVPGLKALDRYTLRFTLEKPRPRFLYSLVGLPAVAHEVVEAYGEGIMQHPVGTGPFMLTTWERSSRIVLSRNPSFRPMVFEAEPAADDAQAQAIHQQLQGRRLPMLDRVEVAIIEEDQPRWLAFLNGEHQLIQRLPETYIDTVFQKSGEVAPDMRGRGFQVQRHTQPEIFFAFFNMKHPLVGGYAPEKVALRRAISLAYDNQEQIRHVWRGQAASAESILPPLTFGYDNHFRTENSLYDLARAKALLDLFGFVDKDGDGWRELPNGQPLVLEFHTLGDQRYRRLNETWLKAMKAVGLRMDFKIAPWPEHLKAARAGRLMMWTLGNGATTPDAGSFLSLAYGPQGGAGNLSFFDLPAYNSLFEQQSALPDGPQRQALMQQAATLLVAHMPYKVHAHRLATDIAAAELVGYWRHPFMSETWQFLDLRAAAKSTTAATR
ncbi:MAG: ABC transporter substrate-binding protein [Burkholderiales bacterium]